MSSFATDTRARLSILWIFVMLNMVFADILSFMSPGTLSQIIEGRAEQIAITPGLLLVFALMTEVPIAMVLLAQVLPYRAARWSSVIAAVFTAVYVVGLGSATPHYVFIGALEVFACAWIAKTAWSWREAARAPIAHELAVD